MKNLLIFSLLISSLTIISCGDDDGPTVTITSPEDGEVYATGDIIITVSGMASDDVGVTDIDITVSGEDIADVNQSVDLSSITDRTEFNFSGNLTVTDVLAGEYELTMTAFDADGNSDEDSVEFSVE